MAKKLKLTPNKKENIHVVSLSDEMRNSFINYAIATISDRALPNVLSGLKPVHTRLIYGTKKLGLTSDKKPSKSQRITGDVMGKYHPHGESYDSMVTISRPFEFWFPYIHIEGNNDDIIGNSAAAARYTEAKLTPFGDMITEQLSPEIVPYEANYDNTEQMPIVLPATFPALLINGTKYGLAVGFSTNIAPHNPIEAIKLTIAYTKNQKMTLDEMMEIMPGPDFPTGGVLVGNTKAYYETGRGFFKNRGVIEQKDARTLVIKEIPYAMGHAIDNYKEDFLKKMADQKLKGFKSFEDYTDGENNQTNIEITFDPKVLTVEKAIAILEKNTDYEQTYNPVWLALDDLTPHEFTLQEYLEIYTEFQHKITINRFKMELKKARHRLEIVLGLLSLEDPNRLDAIIKLAKQSESKTHLEEELQKQFQYTQVQAENIASTPIHRLNNVNFNALKQEKLELENKIYWANKLIAEKPERIKFIVKQLQNLLKKIEKDPYYQRRTTLIEKETKQQISKELFVEDVTVNINKYGYIKMYDGAKSEEEDTIFNIKTKDNDILCAFGTSGIMYQLPLKKLTKYNQKDKSRGELAETLFELQANDHIIFYTTKSILEQESSQMVMVSKKGLAKRFNTKDTKIITSTIRKQTIAYKSKFEDDSLLFMDIVPNDSIDQLTIMAVKENNVKHIELEGVKLQGSASGAGAQTFYHKNHDDLNEVYLIKKDELLVIQNITYGDFKTEDQPLIKETQAFKPIIR